MHCQRHQTQPHPQYQFLSTFEFSNSEDSARAVIDPSLACDSDHIKGDTYK